MLEKLTLIASVLALLAPAAASAQVGFIAPGDIACMAPDPCEDDETAASCVAEGGECVELPFATSEARRVCRHPGDVLCCSGGIGENWFSCPDEFTCRQNLIDGVAAGVCLRAERVYCGVGGAEASVEVVRACHTGPGGRFPVRYEKGDCDRDGDANGEDARVCSRYGLWIEDDAGARSCSMMAARAMACANHEAEACQLPDVREEGMCTTNARTDDRPLCSIAPHVFCCGTMNDAECPAGRCILPDGDDAPGYCTNPDYLCKPYTIQSLEDCHSDLDGNLTTAADGDCDRDGITNAHDPDHCNPPDAGLPAGDAGPTSDAGARMDAGAMPVNPGFAGGGGCVCRSAPGRPSEGVWIGLALLGLAILVRRR